jgi:hypothetical protein
LPLVHHPGRAAAVAAVFVLAAAGCDQSDSDTAPPPGSGAARIGTPLRLADCEDWRQASVRERYGTVRELAKVAGGPVGTQGGKGATLDDDKAYQLLDNYCKADLARSFKLYKLYARAASFGAR